MAEPSTRAAVSFSTAAVVLVAVHLPALIWLFHRWSMDAFYSHGFLVPAVSLGLLVMGRERLHFRPALRAWAWGLPLVSAFLLLLAARLRFEMLGALSLLFALSGGVLLAGGRELWRECRFPVFFLLFAVPLPLFLLQSMSVPLQVLTASTAGGLLDLIGVSVVRTGVHLHFSDPPFDLVIQDACSGMRSIVSVLALSVFVAWRMVAGFPRRLLVIAAGLGAAILANIFRVFLTACAGLVFGGENAMVFYEYGSGVLFFLLVVAVVVLLAGRLRKEEDGGEEPESSSEESPFPVGRSGMLAGLLLAGWLGIAGALSGWIRWQAADAPRWKPAEWSFSLKDAQVLREAPPPGYHGERTALFRILPNRGTALQCFLRVTHDARYLHAPEICWAAEGWTVDQRESEELKNREGAPLFLEFWRLSRGRERAGLAFGYFSGERSVRGSFRNHLETLRQRLLHGVSDTVYMELTGDLGLPETEKTLREVAAQLFPRLQKELEEAGRREIGTPVPVTLP